MCRKFISIGNKMRSRSNSGVQLDYYQRVVHKLIMCHQVSMHKKYNLIELTKRVLSAIHQIQYKPVISGPVTNGLPHIWTSS